MGRFTPRSEADMDREANMERHKAIHRASARLFDSLDAVCQSENLNVNNSVYVALELAATAAAAYIWQSDCTIDATVNTFRKLLEMDVRKAKRLYGG